MSTRPNSFNRMDYGVETIKRQIGCVRLVGHRSACGRRLSLALPVTWTAPLQLRYAAWGARQEYYNTFAYALLLFLWFFRYLHFCVRWSWSNVYSVPGPDLSGCMEEVGDQGTGFSSNRSPSTMSLFSLPHRPPSTFSCSFLTRLICSILSCHPQPLVNSSLDVWRNFLSSTSPETRTPLPPRASTQLWPIRPWCICRNQKAGWKVPALAAQDVAHIREQSARKTTNSFSELRRVVIQPERGRAIDVLVAKAATEKICTHTLDTHEKCRLSTVVSSACVSPMLPYSRYHCVMF